MKKIVLFGLACCWATQLAAQVCEGYFMTGKGSQWQQEIFDQKDKSAGVQTFKILDQTQTGGQTNLKINMVYVDQKGKEVSRTDYDVRCSGQQFEIDMRGFLSEEQFKAMQNYTMKTKEGYLPLPHVLKEGQDLPDGNFAVEGYQNDKKMMDLVMTFTNRKVVGKESVTVPAGTFECYKITYNSEVTIKVLGMGIPIRMEVLEWVAKGQGVVKQEHFRKGKRWSYVVRKKNG
jgi:hypothetical protein